MTVGLFIPCYINQLYPHVGIATLNILENLGLDVFYPMGQTCCGQPLGNSGYEKNAQSACNIFIKNFKNFDYVVGPSGSCVHYIREHYNILPQTEDVIKVRNNTYELCEFLVKVLKKTDMGASFKFRVGLHKSCSSLRGLKSGSCSELVEKSFSNEEKLLKEVAGLELVTLDRKDECCGFGGTFSVVEEAVSVKMGKDRIHDHINNNAEVITGTDMSCLMHLEGLIKRNKQSIRIMHISEILNTRLSWL